MKYAPHLQRAWDDLPSLPPIDFSEAEARHIILTIIRAFAEAQAAGGGTSPTPPAVPPAQVPGGVPSPPGTIFLGIDRANDA